MKFKLKIDTLKSFHPVNVAHCISDDGETIEINTFEDLLELVNENVGNAIITTKNKSLPTLEFRRNFI